MLKAHVTWQFLLRKRANNFVPGTTLETNFRKVGFDPADIRKILISHAHIDHWGAARAVQELCGAPIYMSRGDDEVMQSHPERVFLSGVRHDFTVDEYYDDDQPICQGNITIRTKLCAGHTPGTTSFFFEDTDADGTVYRCAMHGGAGNKPFFTDRYLNEMGYPLSIRQQFLDDCTEMSNYPVDICLASHQHFTNFFSGLNEQDRNDFSGFVDRGIWRQFMQERVESTLQVVHEPS